MGSSVPGSGSPITHLERPCGIRQSPFRRCTPGAKRNPQAASRQNCSMTAEGSPYSKNNADRRVLSDRTEFPILKEDTLAKWRPLQRNLTLVETGVRKRDETRALIESILPDSCAFEFFIPWDVSPLRSRSPSAS